MQPSWTVLGDRQRAARGDRGNPDAGAEVEVGAIRQRKDAFRRDDGVLLGGAAGRSAVAGEGDPDAVTDAELLDSGPDLVDDARAVMVRNHRFPACAAKCTAA